MIGSFIVATVVAFIIIPYTKQKLEGYGILRRNYLGKVIVNGMGIGFLPPTLIGSTVLMLTVTTEKGPLLFVVLGITVMSFAGILDDILCDGSIKGLKGHLGHLLRGRLTTGSFKAIMAGVVALIISMELSTDFFERSLNSLLFMLFTNFFNLLDLRPGRAIKVFFLAWSMPFCISSFNEYWAMLCPLAGGIVAYLPYEMKREGMMGDAGANGIGAGIGLYYCYGLNPLAKTMAVIILAVLHIISEMYSFTEFIRNNKVLRYIDDLGNGGCDHI